MSQTPEEHEKLVQILYDAGFEHGWAMRDGVLIVWEHKEEPPAPFTRPVKK